MKILHVIPTYLPAWKYGGPIASVHGLCKALVSRGHEVHVFTTNRNGAGVLDVPLGHPVPIDEVQVHYFASRFPTRLYYSDSMKAALTREIGEFDVVHLHAVYVWTTTFTARLCARHRIPYVVAPQGALEPFFVRHKNCLLKSLWLRAFEWRTFVDAGAIHVMSEREGKSSSPYLFGTESKLRVIPNGFDLNGMMCAVEPIRTDREPFFLYLGRISWEKALERLIESLSHAPGVRLVMAGHDETKYLDELIKLARQLGVDNRIQYLGPVYGKDKEDLLRSAYALVLPSYAENFGIVVLEAMAAGCPAIVTPEVGLANVVSETGTGLVAEGDPEIFGEALEKLLGSPATRDLMSGKGPGIVRRHFSWDPIAEKMEAVYREVAGLDC